LDDIVLYSWLWLFHSLRYLADNDRVEKKRMAMIFWSFAYAGYPRSLFCFKDNNDTNFLLTFGHLVNPNHIALKSAMIQSGLFSVKIL